MRYSTEIGNLQCVYIYIYICYIQPEPRILRLPFRVRKGSRAALEGAGREEGGSRGESTGEREGAGGSRGEQRGSSERAEGRRGATV